MRWLALLFLLLPGAAMAQALLSDVGERHEVIESDLVTIAPRRSRRERKSDPPSSSNGSNGNP